MSQARHWIAATRPATLSAAFVPVLVGSACAHALGGFTFGPALAALAGAVFIQIGTNFANDVFDARSGADDDSRLGPTRAVAAGLIDDATMMRAMIGAFVTASLFGVYLITVAGWPVAVLGVASIASGIGYTGGPYPLGYHGLGDVFVFAFFGFAAVCGTVYVQLKILPPLALLAAVPVGALATVILAVNNLRDRETDARVAKRTLAVRLGANAVKAEILTLLTLAYAAPVVSWAGGRSMGVLLPLATLPVGVWIGADALRKTGRRLNHTLIRSAMLLLVFGVLFAIGIALGA